MFLVFHRVCVEGSDRPSLDRPSTRNFHPVELPWSWFHTNLFKRKKLMKFRIRCSLLLFPLENGFGFWKKSAPSIFPPPHKKKQTMMWQSCPSMCQLPRSKSPNLTQVGYQEFGAGKGWTCATTSWWGGNEKTQPKGDVGTPGTPVVLEDWHQEEREDNRCGAVGVCVFFSGNWNVFILTCVVSTFTVLKFYICVSQENQVRDMKLLTTHPAHSSRMVVVGLVDAAFTQMFDVVCSEKMCEKDVHALEANMCKPPSWYSGVTCIFLVNQTSNLGSCNYVPDMHFLTLLRYPS